MRYRHRRQAGVQERERMAEWRFSAPLLNLSQKIHQPSSFRACLR
jgi:hypothetical protein